MPTIMRFHTNAQTYIISDSDKVQDEYKRQLEELDAEEIQNAKNAKFCCKLFGFLTLMLLITFGFYLYTR